MLKILTFLLIGASQCWAIEKPLFESAIKDGDFELRKYSALPIVTTPMKDMEKRNDSFRSLFRYIRGENAKNEKIAMTAPVFMETGDKADKNGRMSFFIPSKVSEKGAPSPKGDHVVITEIGAGYFAVLKFKGWNQEQKRKEAQTKLARHISKFSLKPIGQSFFAYYNPPWTPELFRRNEVWQRVEAPVRQK